MMTPEERQRLLIGNALVTLMWVCAAAIAAAGILSR